MRKKYRSLEEVRVQAALRQKRWRAKHSVWVKLREKNRWLATKAEKAGDVTVCESPVTEGLFSRNESHNAGYEGEARYEDMALVEGDPEEVRRHARAVSRRTGRQVPGPLMEPEEKGGQRYGNIASMGQASERGAGSAGVGGQETEEERRTYQRLEELKARKGLTRPGVKVNLMNLDL